MSTVTLSIGPKSYQVACADGQEAHIEALGAMIAEKYEQLGAARAPLEAQNLLFAALFLADELADARKRGGSKAGPSVKAAADTDTAERDALRETVAQLEAELAEARAALARPAAAPATPQFSLFGEPAATAEGVSDLAERLEALAASAEASAVALEAAAASA